MTPSPTRRHTFSYPSPPPAPKFPHNLSGAEFRALAARLIEGREGGTGDALAALIRLAAKGK